MEHPLVTVIIATYHRPEALRAAIESVLMQTEPRWKLIVIGDCCTDGTEKAMQAFTDPRIQFINLPARCREQVVPNSIGMALADTDYIAFLNHDDLWLPNHLETAISVMTRDNTEMYISDLLIAGNRKNNIFEQWRPAFIRPSMPGRTFALGFYHDHTLFEPTSSWVIRRALVTKVGLWRPALTIYRTPLLDWILRAWHKNVRCTVGPTTIIQFATHRRTPTRDTFYGLVDNQRHYVLKLIRRFGTNTMIRIAQRQANILGPRKASLITTNSKQERPKLRRWLLNPFFAEIYRVTGWDSYSLYCRICGIPKGRELNALSKRRIGEELTIPDYPMLLEYVRERLV